MRRAAMWVAATCCAVLMCAPPASAQGQADKGTSRAWAKRSREYSRGIRDARRHYAKERSKAESEYRKAFRKAEREYAKQLRHAYRDRRR